MKKVKLKYVIFSIIGISVIASIGATIPYALSVQTENYNSHLNQFSKNTSSAKSLLSFTQFNKTEFEKLVTQLKPKERFAKKLNAHDAVALHFDSSYNFDLNQAVDFSILEQKFPGFVFKLLVPENKSEIEIKKNVLKNIGVNVSNLEKTLNYTAKFDLDFSKQEKSFKFSPENFSATISLANLALAQEKTATEIAILFYKSFQKNFKQFKNSNQALFKTFSEFGGVSFSLGSDSLFLLPSNFEIKPELQAEKLVFSNVNDNKKQANLNLILLDKTTGKEQPFSLKFVDLPKFGVKHSDKFAEIFKKNYEFNKNVSKLFAKNNISPSQFFSQKPGNNDLGNLSLLEFGSWFTKTSDSDSAFLDQVKKLIPNFEPESVIFSLKKPEKSLKNNYSFLVKMTVNGNFIKEELPIGLKLGKDNQYSYEFYFEFDAGESIYGSYFKNAIESFDKKAAENLDSLKFSVKKSLPITVFASTINNKIQHLLNKPLDLKDITKTVAPLFEFLNFSADKKQVVASENKAQKPTEQTVKAPVSATLFQDSEGSENSTASTSASESSNSAILLEPKKEQKAGDYLKNLFQNLENANFPKNTKLFISTTYFDKNLKINLEIRNSDSIKKNLEVEIENVVKDNEAYKGFADDIKTHLFLDWRANVTTKIDDETKKQILESISAVNDPTLKFNVGKEPKRSPEKPHVDAKNQGIYLAERGVSLDTKSSSKNLSNLKFEKGKSIFYAFKPTKLPQVTMWGGWQNLQILKYSLLQAESKSGDKFNLILSLNDANWSPSNIIGPEFEKNKFPGGQSGFIFIPYKNYKNNGQRSTHTKRDFDGETVKIINGQIKKVANTDAKNNSFVTDYLKNSNATILLVANFVEDKIDSNKAKIVISLFSTEYKNGEEPFLSWEKDVPKETEWDFSKNLTFGTSSSHNLKEFDKVYEKSKENQKSNWERDFAGITFKGFALFDRPKTDEEYQKLLDGFRKEYLNPASEK